MIKVENLSKKYGDHYAVRDLSFEIEKGYVYGFLGPNGAGKSTTMNMMTGYIASSEGKVTIDGHDILLEAEEAKAHIGYLPELPPLYQDMTVLEYLTFVAELKNVPKKERNEQINKVMEKTFITDMKNRLIKNLSKGYKQRVGLSQAMLGNPDVIILDEPTVGLDPKQIIEIRELIRELKKEHTVILSSHILSEIQEVCDKILIIAKGRLVASGTSEELLDNLAGDKIIELSVKADVNDVKNVLDSINGVIDIEIVPNNSEVVDFVITVEKDTEIREVIFKTLAEKNMPIYGMILKQKSLEDIFLEVTSDEYLSQFDVEEESDTDDLGKSDVEENDNVSAEDNETDEEEEE